MLIDPIELSRLLGQKYPPTEQQATVIQADLGPMLVVAGAGAGKTETMAARVVWLVANGLINPDQVLGLPFTRKASLVSPTLQRLILRDGSLIDCVPQALRRPPMTHLRGSLLGNLGCCCR